jgi:hypothetical protein
MDRPILWDENGDALVPDRRGGWVPLFDHTGEGQS